VRENGFFSPAIFRRDKAGRKQVVPYTSWGHQRVQARPCSSSLQCLCILQGFLLKQKTPTRPEPTQRPARSHYKIS
ncbi:MAG: hypothetical protein ACK518_02900, partial [bacterium]